MNSPSTKAEYRLNLLNQLLLIGTLVMTYLTVAKELVLFQNEHHNALALIYRIATRAYYVLLAINFIALFLMALDHFKRGRSSIFLRAALIVFVINVLLFSSNNIVNLLEGKPLHYQHHGIGW